MQFWIGTRARHCGVDLHVCTMHPCILDSRRQVYPSENMDTSSARFLPAVAPLRENLVVSVECIFICYWIFALCAKEGIAFILGHARYMKAIHSGIAKNDRLDAHRIAALLHGGMIPRAYVYPPRRKRLIHAIQDHPVDLGPEGLVSNKLFPAMGCEVLDPAARMGSNALQNIYRIGVGVDPMDPARSE